MSGDLIRVILADDHDVVRTGLRAVLSTAPDIEVVAEGRNGMEAVGLVERFDPDVAVMDLTMGEVDGIDATRRIVALQKSTRVLVLTMHSEEEYLVQALEAGARGYLVKHTASRDLIDAVRAVSYGEVYVRPSAARVLAQGLSKKDPAQGDRARYEKLTDRERDVMRLIAQGYSAPEIGTRLNISPKTVETYKQRVNEKLGIAHRSDYVRLALRLGLLVD